MQKVLTDADCKAKPPAAGRVEIADLRQAGLVLRITHMGSRTFGFRFRHPYNRKTLRATIGTYPSTTLEAARKRAREMAAQVEARINPIEARATERETAHTRTFSALAARYLKEHAERHKRPRSAEEDRRNLALKPLDGHALTTAMARFCSEWKEPPSPHDLRRTVNTRLAMLGVAKEIRDRCLNHVTGLRDPESRHYNRYEFQAEKRDALDKWCNALAATIAGRR